MIRRPPRSTQGRSSAASDVYKRQSIYKTDLGSMAGELGIPGRIIDKEPGAGLWAGQTDEGEMGITYAVLDEILKAIETHQETEAESELVKKVKGMAVSYTH